MANKKTVVQMYEEVLALCVTDEQKDFIQKRIEITQKKNASKSTEPTPKQKEKMAVDAATENAIVEAMAEGAAYSATDILKLISIEGVTSTQKVTPRLSALADAGRIIKATVKGRTMYTLPSAE